ncbi:hypothetical protein FACS18948_2340 [Clostridia bacterium]|nr:hypothetical protein FACS18948_2340 [Clostridia bacterium]
MMNNELFEKVEYLRDNADIGYEESAALLERFDGDITKAIIELERTHRVYGSADRNENPWDNVFTRGKEQHNKHDHNADSWFKKLLKTNIQVTRDDENVADVPAIAPIIAAVCLPQITLAGAIIGGLAGYRLHKKNDAKNDDDSNNA